ncbi:uncharacterized protein UTRI_10634_B [Ustilago trichophora]|uniref:Coiled-coil domain-containing protein 16 n=1 Tax=Ustilago trichophora TaxID=86804 RepID=A0A5C3E9A5_9BASI|nr:uncharacterized protein UTRI_10634_B [Ustilago trichophora]
MPADARSLLRAAANERAKAGASGISDPFASYSSTGGLRCSACSYLTIKHESLWGAHVLSKSHRANVTRIREEELRQAEIQRTKDGKRKADDADDELEEGDGSLSAATGTGHVEEDAGPESKKARMEANGAEAIDPEWELFKSQMEATEPESSQSRGDHSAGAALEAEAQLISHDGDAHLDPKAQEEVEEKTAEELEAEERARKEQEEREEILSRLEEEQRQQDEADQRVSALKQRLQRIKQARLEKQKAGKKA